MKVQVSWLVLAITSAVAAACGGSDTTSPSDPVSASPDLSTMRIGEVRVLTYNQVKDSGLTIPATLSTAQYVLVTANVNVSAAVPPHLTVHGNWQVPVTGQLQAANDRMSPVKGMSASDVAYTSVGGRRGAAFESALRTYERAQFSPASGAANGSASGPVPSLDRKVLAPRAAVVPSVNTSLSIKTLTSSGFDGATGPCASYITTTAKVRAVSTHAIVVADDSVPSGGFTTADYQSIADEFDDKIYPTDVSYFGAPTDHDHNDNHVIIYYTPSVNKLTPAGQSSAGGYVGGFFFAGDLFPATSGSGGSSCAASNEGEIFYLLAPDPTGKYGNQFSTNLVREVTRGTVAHEFQHMINAGARLTGNATRFESTWLDEGLSHFAEDAVGRVEAGFDPLQPVGINDIANLDGSIQRAFFLENLGRADYYVMRPDTSGAIADDDKAAKNLSTRGAAWLMLRYAADWFSGNTPQTLTKALSTGPDTGTVNLVKHAGVPLDTILARWLVTMYTDHRSISGLDGKYNYKSYNMRAVLTNLSSSDHPQGTYLPIHTLGDGSSVYSESIPGASGNYFQTSLTNGGARTITFGPSTGTLATSGRIYVIRTQ